MRLLKLTLIVTMAPALAGCMTGGGSGRSDVNVAPSGKATAMNATFLSLDTACRSAAYPTGQVIAQPTNGVVRADIRNSKPQFGPGPYQHCNREDRPALTFVYTSKPGFRGRDSFVARIRYQNGEVRQQRYVVNVR